jgi:hypothetical protein
VRGVGVRPLLVVAALACVVGAVVVLARGDEPDLTTMAAATLVVTVGCVGVVALRWGGDLTAAPVLWLGLFCLFHFGMVWTLGVFGVTTLADVTTTAVYWVATPWLRPAVTVASVGALVFTVTALALAPRSPAHRARHRARYLGGRWRARRATRHPARSGSGRASGRVSGGGARHRARHRAQVHGRALAPGQRRLCDAVAATGLALQGLGVLVLAVAIVGRGGLGLVGGGYLAFLEAAQDQTTGYALWAFGVGSSLTQLGDTTARRWGLVVFAVLALVLFPLGLRGSVLFPACVLLATRTLVGRRVPALLIGVAAVAALGGASVVRLTRVGAQPGPGGLLDGVVSTVTELGFSIRPTAEVMRWSSAGQEPTWFVSFVAVPLRVVEGLTGWHGGPPVDDPRLFNVKVNELVGAIGGSPVAEGYDAAGVAGVVVVMVGLAVVLCRLSRGPFDTATRLAVFPVVALPLTIAVRNSFAAVVPQVAIGLAVVLAVHLWARVQHESAGAGRRAAAGSPPVRTSRPVGAARGAS